MKRVIALIAMLVLGLLAARADSADEQYIRIYNLLLQADDLKQIGQSRDAYSKYLEAQAGLRQIQTNAPNWNSKLIEYRLRQVTDKLSQFTPPQPLLVEVALTPPATNAPGAPPAAVSPESDKQIKDLTEQVNRLTADKGFLEAKLREALAAQPASVDPRELAKAETRLQALQRTNDVFRVALDQAEAKLAQASDPAALKAAQAALADANQKLADQTKLTESLRAQLTQAQAQPQTTNLVSSNALEAARKSLADAQNRLAEQTDLNSFMKARIEQQEAALLRLASGQPGSTNIAVELTNAQKKLAEQTQALEALKIEKKLLQSHLASQVSPLDTNRVSALTVQLASTQAQLAALELKKVPYTPEELTLFKAPAEAVPPRPVTAPASETKPDSTPHKQPPPGSDTLIKEAQRAFAAGQHAEAEKKYLEVLRLDEQNVYTLGNLAAIQMEQKHLDAAETNLQKALVLDPQDAFNLSLLGILKFRQEQYDAALDALSRAVKLDANNAETYNYLGITLSQKGQREAAETALRKAIQLSPGYGSAHHNLAIVYATQKPPFPELARYHYQKATAAGHAKNPDLEKLLVAPPAPAQPPKP